MEKGVHGITLGCAENVWQVAAMKRSKADEHNGDEHVK